MNPGVTGPGVALRTSLIWHGEVMDDIVCADGPRAITLGSNGRTTFTVPNIGLPANFAILRPGARGYLLTLGANMRGKISIEGKEKSVADFVQHGDVARSGFHATAISGRDWGVVDLDESGDYQMFFQFVPADHSRSVIGPVALVTGIVWFVLLAAISLFIFLRAGCDLEDAILNGFGFSVLGGLVPGLIVGGIVSFVIGELDLKLSYIFSALVHGVLLIFGIIIYQPNNPYIWPGERSMTGNYLLSRLQDEPPPDPPKPVTGAPQKQEAAKQNENKKKKDTATENAAGAAGGHGDKERARTTHPTNDKPAPPPVALLDKKNVKEINNVIDQSLHDMDLNRFRGLKSEKDLPGGLGFGDSQHGYGVGHCKPGTPCTGTRSDSGKGGSGGGGHAVGDFVTNHAPLDTGKERPGGNCVGEACKGNAPREVKVGLASPSGDLGGLTAEEIDRVVRLRAGLYKACYQKELNHTPGIGGKMVVHFVINGEGHVTNASGSGLGNAEVESCVVRNIKSLVFPAKGGIANVNYPFVFSQGG